MMALTDTHTKTFSDFVLNDSLPERLVVRDTAPPKNATRTYSVVADYGWAERILCSDSYRNDANSIARIIGEYMDIPVSLAEVPPVTSPDRWPAPVQAALAGLLAGVAVLLFMLVVLVARATFAG
jgi:hypothetical protein